MTALPSIETTNPAVAYERQLVDPLFRPWAQLLLYLTEVAEGDRLLDVGCGTGIVARLAAERLGTTDGIVGTDLSRGMLEVARQLQPRIDWRPGHASNLPLEYGEMFDVVLCNQALQFFPDRELAVREMRRAMAPGGRLGISTWSPLRSGFLHDLHLIAEQRLGPVTDRRHEFGEEAPMLELLRTTGLEEVAVQTQSRRVTFPDSATFLQLNSRALVGMSPRTASLSEGSRQQLVAQLVADSTEVARQHTTADGLTFPIGSLIAIAHR